MMIQQAKRIVLRQPVAGGGGAGDAAEEAGDLAWGAEGGVAFVDEVLDLPDVLDGDRRLG